MYINPTQCILKCAFDTIRNEDLHDPYAAAGLAGQFAGTAIPRGLMLGGLGALFSPQGERMAGATRGIGMAAGSAAGGIGGQVLTQLLARALTGYDASEGAQAIGSIAGTGLGAYGGYRTAKKITKTDREKAEELAAIAQ